MANEGTPHIVLALKRFPALNSCSVLGFLELLTTSASAETVAVIAVDRYLSIARPMIYGDVVTVPRSSAAAAVAWVVSFLISMPPLFGLAG